MVQTSIAMTDKDREILRQKITEQILKYEQDVKDTEAMTEPVKPENSLGRISRMDAINNKAVMEVSLRNKKSKLSKLKLAITRIDEPGFGSCSICNNMIQAGRLMYMPESTKCVRCAGR